MQALSFLAPVMNLVKKISFLYRLIGVAIGFMFFSSNIKDVLFLSSYNDAQPMTIEMLSELPAGEIPRYLQLEAVSMLSDLYVATQNEDTGEILDASYPVYSSTQKAAAEASGQGQAGVAAKVLIKDKDFAEESLLLPVMNVAGMYDNESFGEVKGILEANGIKVADDAILLVKGEQPPSMGSSALGALVTGVLGLLLALSFVPRKFFGLAPEEEEAE